MARILLLLTSTLLLLFMGCENDPCEDVNCGAHGTCTAIDEVAICECEPEWEMDANGKCEFYKLDNYAGTYAVAETCTLDLTSQEITRNYTATIRILSQLNRELGLAGIGQRQCGAQPLEVEGVVSNTSFAFKTGDYCASANARFVLTEGGGALNEDGTYSMNYRLQYYEFGTVLEAETCEATLTPQ